MRWCRKVKSEKFITITVRVQRLSWVKAWLLLLRFLSPILLRFFDADTIFLIAEQGAKKLMKVEIV